MAEAAESLELNINSLGPPNDDDFIHVQSSPSAPGVSRKRALFKSNSAIHLRGAPGLNKARSLPYNANSPPLNGRTTRKSLIRGRGKSLRKTNLHRRKNTLDTRYNMNDFDITKEVWHKIDNIRVIARFRPSNEHESTQETKSGMKQLPIEYHPQTCVVHQAGRPEPHKFNLDAILPDTSMQFDCYELIGRPMLHAALNGYNTTIFAYGQTGSGKTYTMFGPDNPKTDQIGLVPRVVRELFAYLRAKELEWWEVSAEYVQVYNEEIMDLLAKKKKKLEIRLDKKTKKPAVRGLTHKVAEDAQDVFKWLQVAMKNRVVRGHDLNAVSSRSHMVVTVRIVQQQTDGKKLSSRLNFADLAGSEKSKKTGHKSGSMAMRELIGINKSLSTLTMCIQQILRNQKPNFRDSKLTHLLAESLNGNCKTTLVVACSPSAFNRDETINTLRFAKNAKEVKTKAKVNQELSKKQLQEEIQRLLKVQKSLEADKLALQSEIEGWKKRKQSEVSELKLRKENSDKTQILLKQIEFLKQQLKETEDELDELKRQLENRDAEVVELRNELNIRESEARQMQNLLDQQYKKEEEMANQLTILSTKKSELEQTKLVLEKAKRTAEEEAARLAVEVDCNQVQLQANKEEVQKYLEMIEDLTVQLAQIDEVKKVEILRYAQEISEKDETIVQIRRKMDQMTDDMKKLQRKLELAEGSLKEEKAKRTPGRDHLLSPKKIEIKRFSFEPAEKIALVEQPDLTKEQTKKTALEDKDGNIHLRVTDNDLISMTNDIENCLSRWKRMNKIKERGSNNFSDIVLKTRLLVGYFNAAIGRITEFQNKISPKVARERAKDFKNQQQDLVKKMKKAMTNQTAKHAKIMAKKDEHISQLTEEKDDLSYMLDEKEREIEELKAQIDKMKRMSTHHDFDSFLAEDRHAANIMTMLSQQDLLAFEDDDLSDVSDDDSYDDELIGHTILNQITPMNLGPTVSSDGLHGSDQWRSSLKVGTKLDALDNVQMWYTATIVEKSEESVKVRFDGFSDKYDENIPIISSRLAPLKSKAIGGKGTSRSRVQLKIIGELCGFTYFKAGRLMKKTSGAFKSGWIDRYCVLYSNYDFYYYTDANTSEEKGLFNLRSIVSLDQPSGLEFECRTRKDVWSFRAEDKDDFLEWIHILETCRTKIIEDSSHHFTYRRDGSVIMKSVGTGGLPANMDEDDEKFNERCKTHAVSRHASLANIAVVSSKQSQSLSKPIIPAGNVLSCGYLWKIGGFFKTWHRRWIVFSKNRKMTYAEDKGKETKGEIVLWNVRGLRAMTNKQVIEQLSPPETCYRFLFEIETDERKWMFGAESEEELQTWMRSIQQWAVFTATPAAEKNQSRLYRGLSTGLNDLRRRMSRRRTYALDLEKVSENRSRASEDYARVNNERLVEIGSSMRREMELEKLPENTVYAGESPVFRQTFSAEDAIKYMVDAGYASTRTEAVVLGSLLLSEEIIESHDSNITTFEDRPDKFSFPTRLADVTSRVFKEFESGKGSVANIEEMSGEQLYEQAQIFGGGKSSFDHESEEDAKRIATFITICEKSGTTEISQQEYDAAVKQFFKTHDDQNFPPMFFENAFDIMANKKGLLSITTMKKTLLDRDSDIFRGLSEGGGEIVAISPQPSNKC